MRSIIVVLMLLAVCAGWAAEAYSSYTPRWYDRTSVGSVPLDVNIDVYSVGTNIYIAGNVYDSNRRQYNESFANYDGSGIQVSSVIIASPQGYNVTANSISGYNDIAYVVGAISNQYSVAAKIVSINATSVQLIASSIVNLTDNSNIIHTVFYGVCVDPAGNPYAVGTLVNKSSTPNDWKGMIVSYNPDLTVRQIVYYDSQYYNITFDSCTYTQGYLYVAGTLMVYSSTVNSNLPVYVTVGRILASDLTQYDKFVATETYNSQGYTLVGKTYPDIAATSSGVVIAFEYVDEKPSPSNPSLGGAAIVYDSDLNKLWRWNLTTDYADGLLGVAAGSNGEVIASGYTFYDFGTGLGTSYTHGIVVFLNATGSPTKAILHGASDGNTRSIAVAIDAGGYVYSVGADFSDSLEFYDVTQEVTSLGSIDHGVGGGEVVKLPGRLPKPVGAFSTGIITLTGVEGENPLVLLRVGPRVTPGGSSSALVVAYGEQVSPPPPIPEPSILVAVAVVLGILLLQRLIR